MSTAGRRRPESTWRHRITETLTPGGGAAPRAEREAASIRAWFSGRRLRPAEIDPRPEPETAVLRAQRVRAAPAPASRCAR